MNFLFQPVANFSVGQKFGESKACTENTSGVPIANRDVKGKVNGVCPTGYVELYPLLGMKGHTGIDCHAPTGTPCYASRNGIVSSISTEVERGMGVDVITDEKFFCTETNQAEYFKYRCWHFMSVAVKRGQKVGIGALLGRCDSTGLSAGSHLHFELKPVRKNTRGGWYNVLQDNGYFGSVDPLPYIIPINALKELGTIKSAAEKVAYWSETLATKLRKYI